jgi:hypothetical protein
MSGPPARVTSGEWREKEPGSRPGRDKFRPATTKERGKSRRRAKKQPQGIEDQKSSHEKIKIRTLKTVRRPAVMIGDFQSKETSRLSPGTQDPRSKDERGAPVRVNSIEQKRPATVNCPQVKRR